MAKAYDVPADILIGRLAEILKKEDIPAVLHVVFQKSTLVFAFRNMGFEDDFSIVELHLGEK